MMDAVTESARQQPAANLTLETPDDASATATATTGTAQDGGGGICVAAGGSGIVGLMALHWETRHRIARALIAFALLGLFAAALGRAPSAEDREPCNGGRWECVPVDRDHDPEEGRPR